jgi:omega-6 fatty acid desaturase (delta-12 desaturase)
MEQITIRDLPRLVSNYRFPNTKKAVLQIISSFWPFIAILLLIYGIVYYSILPIWAIIPLSIINAFFLVRIFIIQHDCWHQSYFHNKKLNNIIGTICSFFSLIPYSYRAKSHNFHHNHNSKLRKYRDIGDILTYSVEEFKKLSKWKKTAYRVFRNPFLLFGIGPARYVLIQNRIPSITLPGRDKERLASILNNIWIIVFYTVLWFVFGWKALVFAHFPIILAFSSIAIRFFYIQHQHELTYKSREDKRDYVTAAIKWSSFYKLPNRLHRLTGNIGYHHIHHLNASVPSYELARCYKEIPLLQSEANSLTIKESLKSLRCHLRDEHQQKMISFREYYKKYAK